MIIKDTIRFTKKEMAKLKKSQVVYKMYKKEWYRFEVNGYDKISRQIKALKRKIRMLEKERNVDNNPLK